MVLAESKSEAIDIRDVRILIHDNATTLNAQIVPIRTTLNG